MPILSFIDVTTIHVEFRSHVCLKFFVTVRLFNRSFKALAEIVLCVLLLLLLLLLSAYTLY